MEVLTIANRKGVSILAQIVCRHAFAIEIHQCTLQAVLPGGGRLHHPALQFIAIIFDFAVGRAVDNKIEARQYRLGETGIKLHLGTLKGLYQYILNTYFQLLAVAFSGQIDQTGEEALEGITGDKQTGSLSFLETVNIHRHRSQLIDRYLKQGITGIGIEQIVQRFSRVPYGGKPGPLHHFHHFFAQQGYISRRAAIGG